MEPVDPGLLEAVGGNNGARIDFPQKTIDWDGQSAT